MTLTEFLEGKDLEQQRLIRDTWAAAVERCAKIADEHARRYYPSGSENSHFYNAQAHWAERIAATIRREKQ